MADKGQGGDNRSEEKGSGQLGPELSGALDARDHASGLDPGFPRKPPQRMPQTKPSAFAEDETSDDAIPVVPPAQPDGS